MSTAVPPLALPALVDHHCHGVARSDLGPDAFVSFLSESDAPAAPGTSFFDSQLGYAVRRWCPPLLGLDPHCAPAEYLERRRELGPAEAARRLLGATGITDYVVDTGIPGDLTSPQELARMGGAVWHEVVRLERLAEHVADTADGPAGFLTGLADAVEAAAGRAVAFKSVAAYRYGLDFEPNPPGRTEVRLAADRWLAHRAPGGRVSDPVLLRHLLWSAAETGLPLQLHTGFGDPDLRLHRCDPSLLTDFARAVRPTGSALVLLHCYPYHRGAAYLAHAFPHVYADLGLALSYSGARAEAVLAEALELAPFGKLMFSTDAYGLPELYVVGAALFRRGLDRLLAGWVGDGAWSASDAARVAELIGAGNARRVYGLGRSGSPPAH
ncbi:amidohydrolase family protein [Streptomyces huiliensis]|uniref:amidohydrolase family protein n=1 Tax=Streptomyces huiliensis TaxID=2876027 RepID=UPI001CC0610C|nr:amidohydrolase family protein [Streptomyces huiliensis]MBZ4321831.1 amidohydrolase family protein [Streptomyces huiliensis]